MLSLALLTACSGLRLQERPVPLAALPPDVTPTSCLAMSGGGIRSGAVSLGAIQALYAAGALPKYPLISTVSGGGYPVYGLLYRMLVNDVPLRNLLRERSRYIADVERNAGFISGTSLGTELFLQGPLGVPLSWIGRSHASLQPAYIAAIHQTFVGESMSIFGRLLLMHAREIRAQQFPLPIFGAAMSEGAKPPPEGYRYRYDHFFEMSPLRNGAPVVGYFPDFAQSVGIGPAIAMSAAAIDTPKEGQGSPGFVKVMNFGLGGSFDAPTASGGGRQSFYLSDGGFIENLALLPLLRHGCREILAFDNSGDEKPPFRAWADFAAALAAGEEPGWRVTQPLRAADANAKSDDAMTPWTLPGHIWDAELANAERRVHIRLVKLGIDRSKLDRYPISVQDFARRKWPDEPLHCTGSGLGTRCPFPLEAVPRQSFAPEEFRAYRRLGQWLTNRALCMPSPHWESHHENTNDRLDCAAGAERVLESRDEA